MSARYTEAAPVGKADNLTTILCFVMKSGNLNSWNPLGHSRPVTGLLYLYLLCEQLFKVFQVTCGIKAQMTLFCDFKNTKPVVYTSDFS